MSVEPEEFIKVMSDLKKYMQKPLEHAFDEINPAAPNHKDSPVGKLGDVLLHMYHYTDFESARIKWEERKARINWDNLLFAMWTNEKEIIQKVDRIKEKKIIFTEIDIEKDYIVYLDPNKYFRGSKHDMEQQAVAHRMNACATGGIKKYDIFDLLLYAVVKESGRVN